jgi:excisionase family DNA binding protein
MAWRLRERPIKPSETQERDIITVHELAGLLPLSERVLWERIRKGEIPGFKIGRRVFVRRSEVEEILRAVR